MRSFVVRIMAIGATLAIAAGVFSVVTQRDQLKALQQANGPAATWDTYVDEYLDQGYFKFKPSDETLNGFHKYDSRLEPY